jgi:predicted nucleic acid-binding protein
LIVVDSSVILALLDADDRRHAETAAWYAGAKDDLATTPFILAEVDYLAPRAGGRAQREFRQDLVAGAYRLEWSPGSIGAVVVTAETYRDLGVSLADASLVHLAARLETTSIATFDERHFRAIKPLSGEPAFTLLPADSV